MDAAGRSAHIEALLLEHGHFSQRLHDHRNKLLSHHRSKERDRALMHCIKDMRRADKLQRNLERALRNERKRRPALARTSAS